MFHAECYEIWAKRPRRRGKRVKKQVGQQPKQLGKITVFFGGVEGEDKKTRSFSWKCPTFLRKCPTFFGKSPTFFCVSPWISFVLWAAIVGECEGCESKKCIIAVACARARETRCWAYAVFGNSANGFCRWTGTYPLFFCVIDVHSVLLHRWVLIFDPQSHYSSDRAQWGLWKAEETIREKTLFKVLFAMRIYQNDVYEKKKVQFSAYFSLFSPSSTPICVGRWMKRKWGYEEE